MTGGVTLFDTLPPVQRLALSYAPSTSRAALLAFFALDARLAAIVRSAREPMLAQLRLAWWREQLAPGALHRPGMDPLLDQLEGWPGARTDLVRLVDGWEGLTGAAPLELAAFESLARARAATLASLGADARERAAAERMALGWALADLAAGLSHADERQAVAGLAAAQDWRPEPLSRALRPLAVLHGLARRGMARGPDFSLSSLALALRIGLLGR